MIALLIVHTPGHAPDHICLWHEVSRTLFGGDLLVEGGTIVVPGGRGGNLPAVLASLNRIAARSSRSSSLPAHGEVIARLRPAHRAMRRAPGRARAAGRRCDCGRRGFRGGNRRPGVPDLTPERRAAAAETVVAHLDKLREEKRVVETDGRVTLIR